MTILKEPQGSLSTFKRWWIFLKTPRGRTMFGWALISGLFTTIYKAGDNIVVHNILLTEDKLTTASTYLILGGWGGVISRSLYSYLFGRQIDDQYKGLLNAPWAMHKIAFWGGLTGAIATLATLSGHQGTDPGVIIALSSAQVIFMLFFDRRKGQHRSGIIPLVFFTLVGCALSSYEGSWVFPWMPIFLILFVASPLSAIGSNQQQDGARASDSVVFPFWRFVWLAGIGSGGVVLLAILRGKLDVLGEALNKALTTPAAWLAIALVMLAVFFADTTEARSKKDKGSSLTYVFLVASSIQILFGIPITLIGEGISSGVFGKVPHDPVVWGVRLIGVILVVVCTYRLRKALPTTK